MVTKYSIRYRLANRVYGKKEWDCIVVRATTGYSAKMLFLNYMADRGLECSSIQIPVPKLLNDVPKSNC